MYVIGVDLGGTKVAGALFTPDGDIVDRRSTHLDKRSGPEVGALIEDLVQGLLSSARNTPVSAIGICVPGICWSETGRVWAPNIPGWEDYPLRDELRRSLGKRKVMIGIDSDRGCSLLGEVWKGAAGGCKDAIFVAVGTGIGAGIFVDGRVLRGAHDISGAIGWMALDRSFREPYVKCGCFEYHASGAGIAKVATEFLSVRHEYHGVLRNKPAETLTAHDIFAAYDSDDEVAREVLHQAVEYWGMAAANLVSLFNPEVIIFGGGIFGPARRFLDRIAHEARKWAQPISITKVRFEVSLLGSDAALYGAGNLALSIAGAAHA
jgi:glucokinase